MIVICIEVRGGRYLHGYIVGLVVSVLDDRVIISIAELIARKTLIVGLLSVEEIVARPLAESFGVFPETEPVGE